MLLKYRSLYDN